MFNHKTSLDELHQPNVESYNLSFVEVRPRSVSNDKFLTSVNLQFPIQIAGGKYVDLSRSYFEFELDVGVLPKGQVGDAEIKPLGGLPREFSSGPVAMALSAEGAVTTPPSAGFEASCGLDRAWWANCLSAVRHKVNGNTICSSNDVVSSTIAAMQSHTSDYNENQGSAFCYQIDDRARRNATSQDRKFRTAMRPLQSMNCRALIPGSVSQQIELDFKQFALYKQAIFKINGVPDQLLNADNDFDSTKMEAAFGHIDSVPKTGDTPLTTDKVFFGITDIKLMVCTVADKMNRAIPQSMLLEWEDHDVHRVNAHTDQINAQIDIQHGHRASIFTRLPSEANDAAVNCVAPGRQAVVAMREASVLIGGVQYPTPAYRLVGRTDADALRAYLLYYDANSAFSQQTPGGEKSFLEWSQTPLLSQKLAIASEPGKQKLSTTLRIQYENSEGNSNLSRDCTLASSYIKAALLSFTDGELRSVRLSTV